jgi:hypothetical protein
MPRPAVLLSSLCAALLALAMSGCAARLRSAATELPHQAVPAVIEESVRGAENPELRSRVAAIVETPEVKRAIDAAVKEGVDAALAELTSKVSRAKLQSVVTSTSVAVGEGVMQGAAREIPQSVGPAVRQSLVHELERPDLRDALGSVVADSVTRIFAGTQAALEDYQKRNEAAGRRGPVQKLTDALTMSWGIAFVVGVVLIALVATIIVSRRRAHRYHFAIARALARREEQGEISHDEVQRLLDALR